jgi:ribosome maturation factor RimP
MMVDTGHIKSIIEPIIKDTHLELFDVTFQKENEQWFLRIFIDKRDGQVQLSECEQISRVKLEAEI